MAWKGFLLPGIRPLERERISGERARNPAPAIYADTAWHSRIRPTAPQAPLRLRCVSSCALAWARRSPALRAANSVVHPIDRSGELCRATIAQVPCRIDA